jgi:hypothetical protein
VRLQSTVHYPIVLCRALAKGGLERGDQQAVVSGCQQICVGCTVRDWYSCSSDLEMLMVYFDDGKVSNQNAKAAQILQTTYLYMEVEFTPAGTRSLG